MLIRASPPVPLFYRVISAGIPWIAAADSFYAHPTALQSAVFADGLQCILRTGGLETAMRPGKGRNKFAIEFDEQNQQLLHLMVILPINFGNYLCKI